jgi:hypothetical protein
VRDQEKAARGVGAGLRPGLEFDFAFDLCKAVCFSADFDLIAVF